MPHLKEQYSSCKLQLKEVNHYTHFRYSHTVHTIKYNFFSWAEYPTCSWTGFIKYEPMLWSLITFLWQIVWLASKPIFFLISSVIPQIPYSYLLDLFYLIQSWTNESWLLFLCSSSAKDQRFYLLIVTHESWWEPRSQIDCGFKGFHSAGSYQVMSHANLASTLHIWI